jgi:hypothetical protein
MKDMTVEELINIIVQVLTKDFSLEVAHNVTDARAELLRRFDAMKCCGNCQWSISRNCKDWQRYRDCGSYPALDSYCDKWQYDGLTRAEREK